VYDLVVPPNRTPEAHDLLGTNRVVSDGAGLGETAARAVDHLRLLRHRMPRSCLADRT